ncbi:hypothetical protein L9F63_015948, partial [Diploptera punctata]
MAFSATPETDITAQVLDVIGFNRYNAWYYDPGHLEVIRLDVRTEAEAWRKKHNKPVMMTEYGADTMPGLHISPNYIWSEEFQVTYLSRHFQVFDDLRKEGYFIGELIWNFADFNTAQTFLRVGGNRKGIFTRERQPKSAAHHTRKRFWSLAQELDNATPPKDLNEYIISKRTSKKEQNILTTFRTLVLVSVLGSSPVTEAGLLYPRDSESRSIQSLDGIWNFRVADTSDPEIGQREKWYEKELKQTTRNILRVTVPASYNDITQDPSIRDHVGTVWYDRVFYVRSEWNSSGIKSWVRFGSVDYAADVYINGNLVVHHEGGHVPFQAEVTSLLNFGQKNTISVAVNNVLTDITVPQGQLTTLKTDDGTETVQSYTFDFFNYAGIHRPVLLYTTPSVYIDDISIVTDVNGDAGMISYEIVTGGDAEAKSVHVNVLDREGNIVQNATGLQGNIEIPNANLWWPYLMDPDPAYLYTLEATIEDSQDVYRLPVGIRKLEWNNDTVTINGKPLYLRGFGRHEDSDIRGKGHDFPLIVRDYNLIKWMGANAYRTSHYPYSEEIMDFADREGIMIIDESPAVNAGIYGFTDGTLAAHRQALTELYQRDKNRPSVIMWSLANEANTQDEGADIYFRSLDMTRPLTMAFSTTPETDTTAQVLDVIGFNRYNSWYSDTGHLEVITYDVRAEAEGWRKKHNKPVLMTEYGADTMAGMHTSPEYVWSEEYQVTFLSKHFEIFDELRKEGYFIGELIWNFADFNTAQSNC